MHHILRAHQLCMEGFSVLYDDRLSTVWSAPNYCYRCGNMASILEIGPDGNKHFNVFDAAPENERDGPQQQMQLQQQQQQAQLEYQQQQQNSGQPVNPNMYALPPQIEYVSSQFHFIRIWFYATLSKVKSHIDSHNALFHSYCNTIRLPFHTFMPFWYIPLPDGWSLTLRLTPAEEWCANQSSFLNHHTLQVISISYCYDSSVLLWLTFQWMLEDFWIGLKPWIRLFCFWSGKVITYLFDIHRFFECILFYLMYRVQEVIFTWILGNCFGWWRWTLLALVRHSLWNSAYFWVTCDLIWQYWVSFKSTQAWL